MTGITDLVQSLGVLAGGLVLRLAAVLIMLAAIAVPALVVMAAWRAVRDLVRRSRGLARDGAVTFHRGARHMENHTWVRTLRDEKVRVGVDDVARRLFANPTRVETVEPGTHVRAGDVVAVVAAGSRRAAISSPVDGTVRTGNAALAGTPALVADDPYFDGWLVDLQPDVESSPRMKAADAPGSWLSAELTRLTGLVEHELGMAAADGGEPNVPVVEALTDEQWGRVAARVLRPQPRVV